MKSILARFLWLFVLILSIGSVGLSQVPTISGLAFGDYRYNFSSGGTGNNSFTLGRVELSAVSSLGRNLTGNLSVQANDITGDSPGTVGIKVADFEWLNVFPSFNLAIGQQYTSTWHGLSSQVWEYRSVEKTGLELYGYGPEVDQGVTAYGTLTDKVTYSVAVGNGSKDFDEKKVYGSLGFTPAEDITLEAYADKERSVTTVKGSGVYWNGTVGVGVDVANQENTDVDNSRKFLVTITGKYQLSQSAIAFARYDNLDPSDGAIYGLFIGGLDLTVNDSRVHIQPNVSVSTNTKSDDRITIGKLTWSLTL